MRRPVVVIVAIVLAARPAAGQHARHPATRAATMAARARVALPPRRAYDNPFAIETTYDRFRDTTTVKLTAMPVEPHIPGSSLPPDSLMLSAWYAYAGERLTSPPPAIEIRFARLREIGGGRPYWMYADRHALTFLLDSTTRVPMPDVQYSADSGSRYFSLEMVTTRVSTATAVRIASAHVVEVQLGDAEFVVPVASLEALRDFLSRMAH